MRMANDAAKRWMEATRRAGENYYANRPPLSPEERFEREVEDYKRWYVSGSIPLETFERYVDQACLSLRMAWMLG